MRTRLECKQFTDSSSLVDNDPDDGLFDSPGPTRLSACVCAIPGKLAHNELVVTLVNITSRQLHFSRIMIRQSPKSVLQPNDWIGSPSIWIGLTTGVYALFLLTSTCPSHQFGFQPRLITRFCYNSPNASSVNVSRTLQND